MAEPLAWAVLCADGRIHPGISGHVQPVRTSGRSSDFARGIAEDQRLSADRACTCGPHRSVPLYSVLVALPGSEGEAALAEARDEGARQERRAIYVLAGRANGRRLRALIAARGPMEGGGAVCGEE